MSRSTGHATIPSRIPVNALTFAPPPPQIQSLSCEPDEEGLKKVSSGLLREVRFLDLLHLFLFYWLTFVIFD